MHVVHFTRRIVLPLQLIASAMLMLTAPPVSLAQSAAGDRTQMMQVLGIPQPGPFPPPTSDPNRPAGLRQNNPARPNSWTDASGRAYQRSPWGTWSNYDEAKAGEFTLPDPLVLKNGQPVTNAKMWWEQRRPELLNDLLSEMYGKIPSNTPGVTFEVTATERIAAAGGAIMKRVIGHIDNSRLPSVSPSIQLTLYTPADAHGPVPVMVIVVAGPGGYGAPRATTRSATTRPAATVRAGPPNSATMALLLGIGWGYAEAEVGPIQNDYAGGLSSGIVALTAGGEPRKPDDWGVLSAWAWGLSRAMDYLQTDPSVDPHKIGIEGHSRYGKAALLAAALDQRWAIVFPSCSGEGGAKLSRRNYGETLDDVAGGEYYWMAGNILKYGGHWNNLPVDSHDLIAMVAPRPAFINGGTTDQWADPHGEFLAAVAAGPVYQLLGKNGLGTTQMPQPDQALISGDLAFRYHIGGHTDSLDWPAFLQFAQRYFGSKQDSPATTPGAANR